MRVDIALDHCILLLFKGKECNVQCPGLSSFCHVCGLYGFDSSSKQNMIFSYSHYDPIFSVYLI